MAKHTPPSKFDDEIVRGDARSALKDADATQAHVYNLDIEQIAILPDFNPRITGTKDYTDGIETLTGSILSNGFLPGKPLTVYPAEETLEGGGKVTVFYVVDGHRRFEAVQQANKRGAGITHLPVSIVPKTETTDVRADLAILTVLSNNSTRPLSPVELGIVVNRLIGYNVEKAEIARRLNVTPRYVDDLIVLHEAPAAVQEAVRLGKVSATLAIAEVRQHGDKAAERITAAVKAATDAGKEKVTPKAMPKAPAKPKAEAKKAAAKKVAKAKEKAGTTGKKPTVKRAADAEKPIATDADFFKGAIEYALSLPKKGGAGLDWLTKVLAEDATATGELESWLGQPKGAFFDASLRVAVDREAL